MVTMKNTKRDQLKIVIVGHVDHGKSTLVGRLFHDTGSLPDGKLEQIQQNCAKRSMPFEWSFLMDALQAERDQGITIDTTQIWFRSPNRDYVMIDAPGHREFLKNMITGAAGSEAALLLVDVEEGVREQTKRHGYLLHLLGVKQIAVVLNKMDRVGYSQARYDEVVAEADAYLQEVGVRPACYIPISAREGDMLVSRGDNMPWYTGKTVMDALDGFESQPELSEQALRFPVQDVFKFDERRIIVGRIESGTLKVGDTILISPSNHTMKVKTIESWLDKDQKNSCSAGESVGITLEDQLFVERGNVISHITHAPMLTRFIQGRIFWLGHTPLIKGKRYKLRINTQELQAEVHEIVRVIDTDELGDMAASEVGRNQVAEVILQVRGLAAVDDVAENARTGRFVLIDGYDVTGGGIISTKGLRDMRVASSEVKSKNIYGMEQTVSVKERAHMNGHMGGVLWLTGLSGAGKSTLAQELEKRLFSKGYQVYVLDGDNVRQGLNSDLGFAPEDRTENIRRVGEVAALFANAGMIVISAFISPYREDRKRARTACPEAFHEIYVKADVATCETRDVKGLYKKARAGQIAEFTGISAPYEEPEAPEMVVDTMQYDIDVCVVQLMNYIQEHMVLPLMEVKDS